MEEATEATTVVEEVAVVSVTTGGVRGVTGGVGAGAGVGAAAAAAVVGTGRGRRGGLSF